MDVYCASVDAGADDLFLVERPNRDAMPLLVDLDFRLPVGDDQRRYDGETITDFLREYMRCACTYIECDRVTWYVLEKPGPRPTKAGATILKDGIHLMCPGVVASAAVQCAIRADFLVAESTEGFFNDLSTSSGEDVYDKAVLGTNGWMLYGSRKAKDDPCPWKVTRVVEVVLEGGDWSCRLKVPVEGTPGQLARTLCIHREKDDATPLTDAGTEVDVHPLTQLGVKSVKTVPALNNQLLSRATARESELTRVDVPEYVTDTLRRLVHCLDEASATDRPTWVRVGVLLKSIGMQTGLPDRFLDLFLNFSRKSTSKFESDERCMSDWATFCRSMGASVDRKLSLGTLVMLARRGAAAGAQGMPNGMEIASASSFFDGLHKHGELPNASGPEPHTVSETTNSPDINRHALVDALKGLGFEHLSPSSFNVTPAGIRFKGNGVEGVVTPDYRVVTADGADVGMLFGEFQVPHSLAFVHNNIPPDGRFACKMDSGTLATLKGNPPHADKQLVLHNLHDPESCFASVLASGKADVTVDSRGKINRLLKVFGTVRADHARSVFGITTTNNFININNYNGGGLGTGGVTNPRAREDAFEHIRDVMLHQSCLRGLRKAAEVVYEPVPGSPCGFAPLCSYDDFVGEVLRGDRVYMANPRRHEEALRFLRSYRKLDGFPELEPDRDLLSFSDGVLHLPDARFFPNADLAGSTLAARAARHHIPLPFEGEQETPMLDLVLDAQFDPDVKLLLLAMMGRLLFRVGQLDGFQVMPYLVGVGGTGKSLILSVVKAMYAPGSVGNLSPRREEIFGMANIADKQVVIGRDMPEKLSGVLPQEHMQLMTSGEDIEVPRKGQIALNVTWSAPTILASNHLPDYVNKGNNVGRRLVTFRFDNPTTRTVEDLLERILASELPAVVRRALTAYHELRARAAEKGGFWRAVPETIIKWQSKLAAATNKLYAFLSAEDSARGCCIQHREGAVTTLHDLEDAFKKATGGTLPMDTAVLSQFGYTLSQTKVNICKSCKGVARGGRDTRCCPNYGQANRDKKTVVHNMALSQCERDGDGEEESVQNE